MSSFNLHLFFFFHSSPWTLKIRLAKPSEQIETFKDKYHVAILSFSNLRKNLQSLESLIKHIFRSSHFLFSLKRVILELHSEYMSSFNPHTVLMGNIMMIPHFTDRKTGPCRGQRSCVRLHF